MGRDDAGVDVEGEGRGGGREAVEGEEADDEEGREELKVRVNLLNVGSLVQVGRLRFGVSLGASGQGN